MEEHHESQEQLKRLGYNEFFEKSRSGSNLSSFGLGRISAEHRERYRVITPGGEYDGEITGNLRFSAAERSDFPAVGDWVAISEYDSGSVLIHAVLQRQNMIQREAPGSTGQKQLIAANIDYALIIQPVDGDFSVNRLERYMTICNSSGVTPIIVISKVDLVNTEKLKKLEEQISARHDSPSLFAISNYSGDGLAELRDSMLAACTYCMMGSSGAGKSTLMNILLGNEKMDTGHISESTGKGRHVTTHRELVVLDNGAILVDNPGMREVGIADSPGGLEATFDLIHSYSRQCRYKDCTHQVEEGCAVRQAVAEGSIDKSSYDNYLNMLRERAHFESTIAERRRKEKTLGKILKDYKKGGYKGR